MKKLIYLFIGILGLVLGVIGAVLPLLPAFPFLLLAACCFAKSSDRMHLWFIQTKLYENNLDGFVKGKGMTKSSKVKVMLIITILLTFGIIMMNAILVGQIILVAVWLMHLYIFVCRIKTLDHNEFKFIKCYQMMGVRNFKDEINLEKQLNKDPNIFAKVNHSNHQLMIQAKMPLEDQHLIASVDQIGHNISLGIILDKRCK